MEVQVTLKCLFCHQPLQYDTRTKEQPEHGDLIKCHNCGENNDYSSVLEIAQKEGVEQIKDQVREQLKKKIQKDFKGFR